MKRIQRLSLIFLLYSICYSPFEINGQTYQDHFGTGNDVGVSVSTSSDQGTNAGANSLSGTDLIPDLEGASRFLGQASLGANYEDIEHVAQIGIEAWLEEQISLPTLPYRDTYQSIYDESIAKIAAVHGSANVDMNDGDIADIVYKVFDMTPYAIEKRLKLRNPIYSDTAAYGHMGRTPETKSVSFVDGSGNKKTKKVETFTWEKLDYTSKVKKAFKLK